MMLRILGQLTPEERKQVMLHLGPGRPLSPTAGPEDVIRGLARVCGALSWGLFPVSTEEALLEHVGRKLGYPPMVVTARGVVRRERELFAWYFRQAWETTSPDRRREVLAAARAAWDDPLTPPPTDPHSDDPAALCAVLEGFLQHPCGCRALAFATGAEPLPFPVTAGGPPRLGGPPRTIVGHQAMYGVLLVLWKARARLLRERRAQEVHLERELQQLDSLLLVRRKHAESTPARWETNPLSGLSLTAAASTSLAVHAALSALTPVVVFPAILVGAAGLAWAAGARLSGPRPNTDARVSRMHAQTHHLRSQLANVQREIRALQVE